MEKITSYIIFFFFLVFVFKAYTSIVFIIKYVLYCSTGIFQFIYNRMLNKTHKNVNI